MKKDDEAKYEERHQRLLEYQKTIAPFNPTVQEIATVWGLRGVSPTVYVLKKMVNRGWVSTRRSGKSTRYCAVEVQYG